MRKMSLSLLLAGSLVALAGCTSVPPRVHQQGATKAVVPPVEPPPPDVKLTPRLLYQVLVAEFAGNAGRFDTAAVNYLRAAQETRDYRLARRATRIAIFSRQFKVALSGAKLWAQLQPEDLEARQALAALLVEEGHLDAAVVHMKKLLALSAGDPQRQAKGLMLVARLLARQPDRDRALPLMKQLIAPYAKLPEARYAYAYLAAATGHEAQAVKLLDALLADQPKMDKALVLKADLLAKMGRTDAALKAYAEAVKRSPDDAGLRFTYARILIQAGHLTEARAQFRVLDEQIPGNPDVIYARGLLAMQAGDLKGAQAQFRRLLTIGGHNDEAAYALAQIAEIRHQPQEAIRWYSAVGQGGLYIDAQLRVAALLDKTKGLAAARRHLHRIDTEDAAQRIRVDLAEGELLSDAGHYQEAIDLYSDALGRHPGNVELLYARAMAGEKMGRLDILERDLRAILKKEPDNARALNALGYTLADRTDRYQEAYRYIAKAIKLKPNDPAIQDSMGWVLYGLGKYKAALPYLEKANANMNDPEIAAHLGTVLWNLDRQGEARKVWNKALKQFPKNKVLRETVKRYLNP